MANTLVRLTQRVSVGIPKLREVLSVLNDRLFASSHFINDRILWECLTDARDDELLKNHLRVLLSMSPPSSCKTSNQEIQVALDAKLRIASQLVCSKGPAVSADLQMHVSRLASFVFFLLPVLRRLRGALSEMDSPPIDLWTRYAAVAIQLLTLCCTRDADGHRDSMMSVKTFDLAICQDDQREHTISDVVGRLTKIISESDDVHVANNLMEMLSTLGIGFGGVLDDIEEASSEFLRKSLANSGVITNISELPFALIVASKTLKAPTSSLPTLRKALDATLYRMPNSRSRLLDHFWVQRFSLLRHFGLLVQKRSSTRVDLDGFLEILSSEIEYVLFGMENQCRRSSRFRRKMSSEKSPKRTSPPSFPTMNTGNVADFLETSLHMALGATALYPPAFPPGPEGNSFSPYSRLEFFLHAFNRLALLYVKYFCHFPRKFVGALYIAARHMLEVAIVQVNRSADWRSSYKLPKPGSNYDPGSLEHFKQLIHSCRTSLVDGFRKIVKLWVESDTANVVAKGKALEQLIRRFDQTLDDMSSSRGLSLDGAAGQNTTGDCKERKRRRVESAAESLERIEMNEMVSLNGEPPNEHEIQDDGESFGASGDWGGNNSYMDDDSISSAEAITIHRSI